MEGLHSLIQQGLLFIGQLNGLRNGRDAVPDVADELDPFVHGKMQSVFDGNLFHVPYYATAIWFAKVNRVHGHSRLNGRTSLVPFTLLCNASGGSGFSKSLRLKPQRGSNGFGCALG